MAPEREEANSTGRTWADVVAAVPVWLLGIAATAFVCLLVYAIEFLDEPRSLGFLGEFGPRKVNAAPGVSEERVMEMLAEQRKSSVLSDDNIRDEIDRRIKEQLVSALPTALRTDPEIEILRAQRKEIREAQAALAQFRAETTAARNLAGEQLSEVVAEAEAAKSQALAATEAVQARVRDLNNTVDETRVLDQIDSQTEAALEGLDEKLIERLELPKGAVVAFALPRPDGVVPNGSIDDPCPDGWERYHEANGRAVIGVGPDDNPFRKGGERTHTLMIEEMPRHNHSHGNYVQLMVVDGAWTAVDGENDASGTRPNLLKAGEIQYVGENKPHNNMPPYIALYFCKKEG